MKTSIRQLNMAARERHLEESGLAVPQRALRIASHWTPEQALVVYETLDDLIDLIWRQYGLDIQHAFKNQCADSDDNFKLTNINQGDLPF
jgi:hypothetical protein